MKKILLVSRCAWTLFNFRRGLIRGLKDEGHDVVCAGGYGDGYEERVRSLGVRFVRLPIDRRALKPWTDLGLLHALYGLYRRELPDVVHHFTIKPVIYGSLIARLARVPRVVNTVTGLGFVFTGSAPGWLRALVEGLYRLALSGSHRTFFQNTEDLEFFVDRGLVRSTRAEAVPGSGVDTERFAPPPSAGLIQGESPSAAPGPPGAEPRSSRRSQILMVSRLLADKGVREFVEAARSIRRRRPDVQFVLLGRRDDRNPTVIPEDELERWQSEGSIRWLGEVEDVRPHLAEADVVVLPSYREGTPRSLLEAAAMARPIVATDIAGCRDVVDDGVNGYLVPARDSQALGEAVQRMLADPVRRAQMGARGREKILRNFDERSVVARIKRAYEKEA